MQPLNILRSTINSNPKVITRMSHLLSLARVKSTASAFFALLALLASSQLLAQTTVNTATVTRPAGLVLTCVAGPVGTGLSYASGAPASCSATDTDTLTPTITATKTVSASPLVVGGTGQFYNITITVANGPTTAALLIGDTLPSGITLSGAPTITGGTSTAVLASCPVSGSNTTGCQINTGATSGTIIVRIPVNVASTATNGNNTANLSGGGDPACTAAAAEACDPSVNVQVVAADMQAALGATTPTEVSPGQVITGLTATCTNVDAGAATNATCVPTVSAGTISALSCTPSSPQTTLAAGGTIVCTYTYTAPGTAGGADERSEEHTSELQSQ